MEEEVKIIMLNSGEILITGIEDTDPFDDTNYKTLELLYPALIIPIREQPGQIGFQKYFPFSDNSQKCEIRRSAIRTISTAVKDIARAYGDWKTQVKAQEAGIVTATQADMPRSTELNPVK